MLEFLAMGGYAVYVWPSFVITAAVMLWAIAAPWMRHRRLRQRIAGVGR